MMRRVRYNPSSDKPTPGKGLSHKTKLILAVIGGAILLLVSLEPLWEHDAAPDPTDGLPPHHDGADSLIAWSTDLAKAQLNAAEANKPILIDFSADWCPPCKQMQAKVFPDPRITRAINASFIPVYIDMTHPESPGHETAQQHQIEALPTFVVLNHDGTERARLVGGVDVPRFHQWLTSASVSPEPPATQPDEPPTDTR